MSLFKSFDDIVQFCDLSVQFLYAAQSSATIQTSKPAMMYLQTTSRICDFLPHLLYALFEGRFVAEFALDFCQTKLKGVMIVLMRAKGHGLAISLRGERLPFTLQSTASNGRGVRE